MRLVVIPLALALLGGCAQTIAESRVRSALVNAGVSDRSAGCMAGRMTDRLSIRQLRKLEALSGISRDNIGSMRVSDYVRRVEQVGDPEVLAVVTTSALVCATQG